MEEWPTKSFLELCKACLLTLKCKKGFLASTIAHGTCIGFILEWWMTGFSRFKKECFKKFTYLWQMRCRSDMKCVTNYEWAVTTSFCFWLNRDCFDIVFWKYYYEMLLWLLLFYLWFLQQRCLACLEIRSRNENAIDYTRNRIYSRKFFHALLLDI